MKMREKVMKPLARTLLRRTAEIAAATALGLAGIVGCEAAWGDLIQVSWYWNPNMPTGYCQGYNGGYVPSVTIQPADIQVGYVTPSALTECCTPKEPPCFFYAYATLTDDNPTSNALSVNYPYYGGDGNSSALTFLFPSNISQANVYTLQFWAYCSTITLLGPNAGKTVNHAGFLPTVTITMNGYNHC
jgi:hypothetical protein